MEKIPIVAEFTEVKQAPPSSNLYGWSVGDSAYDTLNWHDPCGQQVVVPVAPYNARNTDDPKHIKYRVEDRIKKYSEDVDLKQSTLEETYNQRSGVERISESVKDCGLGCVFVRGRVHTRAQVFLALYLRVVIVAITNYERRDNPRSTVITGGVQIRIER